VLAYDNPRLPQALIEAGQLTGMREWTASGLDTLAWIAYGISLVLLVCTMGIADVGSVLATRAHARAAAYLECATPDGRTVWGCGIDTDIATASVRAVLSAANGAVGTA